MNLINSRKTRHRFQSTSRLADKSRMLALNLADLSLDEIAKITQHVGNVNSRYNEKRNLLILEFQDQHKKVDYMKHLPQWVWNRGAVLWECSSDQLENWIYETLLSW
ncbi:MAG: hypothetical protein PVF82_02105 [Gammaproteobacteria bacterium]